jgi:hypothetical protein
MTHFQILQMQSAVFLSSIDASSWLRIASTAIDAVPGLLGTDPVLLPIPSDAPPEIPRIIIENNERGWTFHTSLQRYDLFFSPPNRPGFETFRDVFSEVAEASLSLWDVFESTLAARSHRLAFVVNLSADVEKAADLLRQRYFNQPFAAGAKEIQLHYLHAISSGGFDLNRWTRLLSKPGAESTPESLLLHVDINTRTESPLEKVDTAVIQRFLDTGKGLIEESIAMHANAEP